MSQVKVVNRILPHENVANVAVTLQSAIPGARFTPLVLKTNASGFVLLPSQGIPDGNYALSLKSPDSSTELVGPAVGNIGTATRIFRPMNLTVLVRGSLLSSIISGADTGGKATVSGGLLKAELQPVFLKSPNQTHRARAIDLVVVHHTAGPSLASAVNQFLTNGTTSSHYLVDKDGQIVKMVPDTQGAWHAGVTYWSGDTGLNANSIGIEIVNSDGEVFTDAQYTAVIALIGRLRSSFPGIVASRVVGHMDVGTNEAGRLGRKSSCPGMQFAWPKLEAAGLGLIPKGGAGANLATAYGGFFGVNPTGALRHTDRDDQRLFGGKKHGKEISGTPIRDVQTQLDGIGYSVGDVNGIFDDKLQYAVQMFQEHFFAGGRGGAPNGHVDAATAGFLLRVAQGANP